LIWLCRPGNSSANITALEQARRNNNHVGGDNPEWSSGGKTGMVTSLDKFKRCPSLNPSR
jgi:hypothetical protein